jgi:hypothetical protein
MTAVATGDWTGGAEYFSAHLFEILLTVVFVALHRFDDNRLVRLAAARLRPEIPWPVLLSPWVLAITVSQGSSAKFIYFDF